MTLAALDFLTRDDWFLISLFLLVISYFLYRPRRVAARAEKTTYSLEGIRDSYDENARESTRNANRIEVKLFEYEREVEGRMQTRLAVLDQMILESERKIEMLQRVLEQSRSEGSVETGTSTRGEIQIFENQPSDLKQTPPANRAEAA